MNPLANDPNPPKLSLSEPIELTAQSAFPDLRKRLAAIANDAKQAPDIRTKATNLLLADFAAEAFCDDQEGAA